MMTSTGLFGHGHINGYQPHEKDHPLERAIREVFFSVRPPKKPKRARARGEWCLMHGCPARKNEVSDICDNHISMFGYKPKEKKDDSVLIACRELMEWVRAA